MTPYQVLTELKNNEGKTISSYVDVGSPAWRLICEALTKYSDFRVHQEKESIREWLRKDDYEILAEQI